jgi:hypothetical protein
MILGSTTIADPATAPTVGGVAGRYWIIDHPLSVRWKDSDTTLFQTRSSVTTMTKPSSSANSIMTSTTRPSSSIIANTTSTTAASKISSSTLTGGAIAGISIAILVVVAFASACLIALIRRRKAKRISPGMDARTLPIVKLGQDGRNEVGRIPNMAEAGGLEVHSKLAIQRPIWDEEMPAQSQTEDVSSITVRRPVEIDSHPQYQIMTSETPNLIDAARLSSTIVASPKNRPASDMPLQNHAEQRKLIDELRDIEAEEERLFELGKLARRKRELQEQLAREQM